MKSRPRASSSLARALLALGLAAVAHSAHAQLTVTGINYGTNTNNPNKTVGGVEFSEQFRPVNSVNTDEGLYLFNGPVATSVSFRRVAGASTSTTLFYQYSQGAWWENPVAYGNSERNLQNVFLSNNLYTGVWNPFANGTTALDGNMERIDFYFNNYVVQAGDALTFFDIEDLGNRGDGFRIAVFTEANGVNGAPSTYANTGLLINADEHGDRVSSPADGLNADYLRATYANSSNLTTNANTAILSNNAGLVGIVISFADLGIAPGTLISGFSLMAGDVSVGSDLNVANAGLLVDYTNSSVYNRNTDRTTWGNIDFMGFGSQVARPIPEPSTYGLLVAGTGLGFLAWRRRRAATRAAVRA